MPPSRASGSAVRPTAGSTGPAGGPTGPLGRLGSWVLGPGIYGPRGPWVLGLRVYSPCVVAKTDVAGAGGRPRGRAGVGEVIDARSEPKDQGADTNRYRSKKAIGRDRYKPRGNLVSPRLGKRRSQTWRAQGLTNAGTDLASPKSDRHRMQTWGAQVPDDRSHKYESRDKLAKGARRARGGRARR